MDAEFKARIERQLATCREEIEATDDAEVKQHYRQIMDALATVTVEGPRILVFRPISTGDLIVQSLAAELLVKKYPGCSVDFMMDSPDMPAVLASNPFIRRAFVTPHLDWGTFTSKDGRTVGEIGRNYDMRFGSYWWNPPMAKSMMEDCGLPTDYTRVKLYKNPTHEENARKFWLGETRLRIMVQPDMLSKWHGDKSRLYEELTKYGLVKFVSFSNSLEANLEILRQADVFVGCHGGLEHAAAAVGCQCCSMPLVYNPEYVVVAYYQNRYRPAHLQHRVVRPVNWCGKYECVSLLPPNPRWGPYLEQGHTFPNKFSPMQQRPCVKGFVKTCIHEIAVETVMAEFAELVRIRGGQP
jgi:hypothetical protein